MSQRSQLELKSGIFVATLSFLLLVGCGEEPPAGGDGDSNKDAESDVEQTDVAADTESADGDGGPPPTDTSGGDTSSGDTSGDTSTGDTVADAEGDTTPSDTSSDTSQKMDTSKMDTAPPDTQSSPDTAQPPDTGPSPDGSQTDGGYTCPPQDRSTPCLQVFSCFEEISTGNCCRYSDSCPPDEMGWRRLSQCSSSCKTAN